MNGNGGVAGPSGSVFLGGGISMNKPIMDSRERFSCSATFGMSTHTNTDAGEKEKE